MRRLAFAMMMATAASASAQVDVADVAADAEAHCAASTAVTRSSSAVQMSPQLFLDYGVVNGNDATTGTGGVASLPPTQRLTFGLRYSISNLFRGVSDRQRAAADCVKYRAAAGLARFVVENREQLSPAALDAKLVVLRQAMTKAEEIVRGVKNAVEHQRATADELEATQLRYDDFQNEIVATEALKAGLPPRAPVDTPTELLRQHREADAEVARYEARLRYADAWDIQLRAGYDQFFGLRDVLPLFGVISFQVNPAILFMPSAESEARRARQKAVRYENDGAEQRVELLSSRLRALLAGERRRLGEVRVLLADVGERLRALNEIESDKLRRFRDATFFDYVKLKAEAEFLRVHTADLAASLGEAGG
jgi:hypothetical protein